MTGCFYSSFIVLFAATSVSWQVCEEIPPATRAERKVRAIEVDFSQTVGKLRRLHGVNCGPMAENFTLDLSPYFRKLRTPDVRLCAPHWPGTDCVEINIGKSKLDATDSVQLLQDVAIPSVCLIQFKQVNRG